MGINTLYWEITGSCNLNCQHCYLGGPQSKGDLTLDESLERVDIFSRNGIEILLLTGGEPLLSPHIFDIIKYANNKNIKTAILSNGTLINEDYAKKISESKPNTIQISIDGLYETHDKIRGKGSFRKIEQAIDNLKNESIKVITKLTINRNNLNDIEDVIDYCASKDIYLNFSLVQELGNAQKSKILPTPQEYFDLYLKLHHKKKVEGFKITLPDFSIEEYLETGVAKSGCSGGSKIAAITNDDYFMPCVFMSTLGLGKKDGLIKFNEEQLKKPNKLFDIITKHASKEFGCPLRKFKYGIDPYSVYEFIRYMNNENL
jgi:MoaA/NifB/PqqE/SkfB family radical SAM enzyme